MKRFLLSGVLVGLALWITACGGGNQPPTASITTPENDEIFRELTVEFSGFGQDPEGDALDFTWDFGDGQTGSGPVASHSYDKGGQYQVRLTVTDGANKTASDTVTIRVNDPPHVVAAIKGEQDSEVVVKFISGEAPLTVDFDATKTSDSDGTIFSYLWDFGDGTNAQEAAPTHTFEAPGDYTVTLSVTDNMGATSRDESITVSVLPATTPPTVDANGVHLIRMLSDGGVNHFEPAFLRIQPGDTVRWINESGVHTTASYSPNNQRSRGIPKAASGWDSGLLTQPGASFEHTFTEAGTYAYFCLPHEALGMVGVIVVGDGPPLLPQDFVNGLESQAAREEFAKQVGIGTGGVIHTVELSDQTVFSPAVLKVKPGDTIRWINTGEFPHTVTAYHPDYYGKALGIPEGAAGWDSGLLDKGAQWAMTVPQDAAPGTYAYFCLPHEALGMVGLLIVETYSPLSEAFISSLPPKAQEAFKLQMEEALNLE